MGRKRIGRTLDVNVLFASDPGAPTLAQVQAEAAPLIAQLLVQAVRNRQLQKEMPQHCHVLADSSARA